MSFFCCTFAGAKVLNEIYINDNKDKIKNNGKERDSI